MTDVAAVELGPEDADEYVELYCEFEWWDDRERADVEQALENTSLAVGLRSGWAFHPSKKSSVGRYAVLALPNTNAPCPLLLSKRASRLMIEANDERRSSPTNRRRRNGDAFGAIRVAATYHQQASRLPSQSTRVR